MAFEIDTIDSHIHLYKWFDKNGKSYINALDDLQNETGVKGITLASLTDPIYGAFEYNIMSAIYKLFSPTAYALANLYFPELPVKAPICKEFDPKTQYEELMEIGFDGFKILFKPDLQRLAEIPFNSPVFEDFYTNCEKDGTYILCHVADPKQNWTTSFSAGPWNYFDGTYLPREEMYNQVFDVLESHPKLNICFAHFFFMEDEPNKLEKLFAKYKNLCVDLAPGLMFRKFEREKEFFTDFLTKYSNRIIYGSDATINENPKNAELMTAVYNGITTNNTIDIWDFKSQGIKIPEKAAQNILSETFKNHCGKTPKAINKAALKKYIEKYLDYIKNEQEKQQIINLLKTL